MTDRKVTAGIADIQEKQSIIKNDMETLEHKIKVSGIITAISLIVAIIALIISLLIIF